MSNAVNAFFYASIAASVPILYAAVGAVFSERSGISNLGLEGVMMMGAVSGFIAVVKTNSLTAAIFATVGVGIIIGLVYAFLVVTLQSDQIVCGLALTIFGTGFSGYIGAPVYGIPAPVTFTKITLPVLSEIPVVGPVLFNQDLMVYALYLIVPLSCVFLYRTKPGLILRAVGENPSAVDGAGKDVKTIRYIYTCFGCVMSALGGAYLTLAYSPSWVENITAGKGWIAVALVIFSTWNPAVAAAGALLFGGIDVLGMRLQAVGITIPTFFISMMPYFCTIAVLILSTGNFLKRRNASPQALGQPYDREDR